MMEQITFPNGSGHLSVPGGDKAGSAAGVQNGSFGKILKRAFEQANQLQIEGEAAASDLATGRNVNLHQTMIALEKAEVSLQLLMQIRNKLVSAYEQVSRMSV